MADAEKEGLREKLAQEARDAAKKRFREQQLTANAAVNAGAPATHALLALLEAGEIVYQADKLPTHSKNPLRTA